MHPTDRNRKGNTLFTQAGGKSCKSSLALLACNSIAAGPLKPLAQGEALCSAACLAGLLSAGQRKRSASDWLTESIRPASAARLRSWLHERLHEPW